MFGRARFGTRVYGLVVFAAAALAVVTIVAVVLGRASEDQITGVRDRYLPLMDLDRDLDAIFAAVRQKLEDAAGTGEPSLLPEADKLRDQLVEHLRHGADTIAANGGDASALEREFRVYYVQKRDVSELIASGHTGEDLPPKVEALVVAEKEFARHLAVATRPDRVRLAEAFARASAAQRDALRVDLAVGLAALFAMVLLSMTLVRRTIGSLGAVSRGMDRLAQGNFDEPIIVPSTDELGDLAARANETARRLHEYRAQSDREAYVKTGVAGMGEAIAGDVDAIALGRAAMGYLARQLDAPVAVAYAADESGGFRLLATYGTSSAPDVPFAFQPGEAIVGQAARDDEVRVLTSLPAGYVKVRSGLGETVPRHVVVVPFSHEGRSMGVIELGLLEPPREQALELVGRVRGALGVAFRVAESRARAQALLEETQRQAEELRDAYDLLERRNVILQESEERLQSQQEELRQTNEELEEQAAALEAQRTAMLKKNQQLVATQKQLEEQAAELERASRYKSDFLANMSHELRTPLNSIMILSKILGEDEARTPAERLEFAKVIHKSGEELLALINDVLDLAKVESGKQDLVLDTLVLTDLATYVRRMFLPLARDRKLALDVEAGDDLPATIRTDTARLAQIVKNLVSNAIKFTAEGGVRVRIARPAAGSPAAALGVVDAVSVAVTDTGIGIPAEKHAFIFEAFAQADGGTSRKYGGTGLGLTIARQLAQRLGGDLLVESEVGKGSTFQLVVPAAGPPEKLEPEAPKPPTNGRVGAPGPNGRARLPTATQPPPPIADDRHAVTPGDACVLIVEDDTPFAEVVLGLVREAGFKGLVATTGQAGLELARRHHPSGIVLDVGLPDLDGWSVMEQLKQDPVTRAIPVHFITAENDPARAERLGAVGFLEKPVDAAQVRSALSVLEAEGGKSVRQVLVVESDPGMRDELCAQLAGSEAKVSVQAVAGGDEAIERLTREAFGCVVLDLALPDKQSGFDLLARIRGDERTASLPVIVHTGLTLSPEEVLRLEVTEQALVILQGERSVDRVLEETRLFVHRVRSDLPVQRARMTEVVHQKEQALRGKTVLIVDDDMRNVYSLSSALRAKDLKVITAADGIEALDELSQHPETNAVLMDVMMPRMDGHEATRRIRADERFGKLPIIALTAKTMPGERKKCLDAGANDYVPKPVDVDRLLALLRVWLS